MAGKPKRDPDLMLAVEALTVAVEARTELMRATLGRLDRIEAAVADIKAHFKIEDQ
jgi:hypothetical protein